MLYTLIFYEFLETVAKGCVLYSYEMQWINFANAGDNSSVLF